MVRWYIWLDLYEYPLLSFDQPAFTVELLLVSGVIRPLLPHQSKLARLPVWVRPCHSKGLVQLSLGFRLLRRGQSGQNLTNVFRRRLSRGLASARTHSGVNNSRVMLICCELLRVDNHCRDEDCYKFNTIGNVMYIFAFIITSRGCAD